MNNLYLGEFEYFATGEGHTIVAAIFVADKDKETAKEIFFYRFLSPIYSEEGYSYLEKGINLINLGDWKKRYPQRLEKSQVLAKVVSPDIFYSIKDVVKRRGISDEGIVFKFRYNLS